MKTAMSGPLIVYGDRAPLGTGATGSNNPDKAPSVFWGGTGLFDPRGGYNLTTAGALAFAGNNSYCVVLDAAPSAIADNNIAASQTPGAGVTAITLVSASGAGINVLSAATTYLPSANSLAANTLVIDTAPALLGFGRAGQGNSSHNIVSVYDPTTLVARNVRVTSGGNDTGITFTVAGNDIYGYAMSEAITGANGGVASGKKAFKFIRSVTASGNVATTVKVGTGDVYGFPLQVGAFAYADIFWNTAFITATTGYLSADATNPATTTTGDVRGTYAVQSASDGTKKLQLFITVSVANLTNTNPTVGLFGITQV